MKELRLAGWLTAIEAMFLLQGAYALCFQAETARLLAVRFDGVELCYAAALLGMLLWTGAGCGAAALLDKLRGKGSNLLCAILCAASPLLALCACAQLHSGGQTIPFFDIDGLAPGSGPAAILLHGLAATTLFGLANGLLLGSACGLAGKDPEGSSYASNCMGAFCGGVSFSLLLCGALEPVALMAVFGGIMPFAGFFACGRKMRSGAGKILCGALCLLLCGALLVAFAELAGGGSYGERHSERLERLLPEGKLRGTLETASGRVELLELKEGAQRQIKAFKNGAQEATLPSEREPLYPTALFATAQPGHADLSILLICSPFSSMGSVLESLPLVARVEQVCPDKTLTDFSKRGGLMPSSSERFSVTTDDPRHLLETTKESYDLILSLERTPSSLAENRLFTKEFFKAAAARLKPGGAFVGAIEESSEDSAESARELNGILGATLATAFKKQVFAPDELKLFAAGDESVSADFDELDARIASLMPAAQRFPKGLLGVILSQAEQKDEAARIARATLETAPNADLSPSLPYLRLRSQAFETEPERAVSEALANAVEWAGFYWKELLGGCLLLYALARYFMSWKMSRKTGFQSFENGFYATGISILLLFLLQTRFGTLYRDFGMAVGTFLGGASLGALLGQQAPDKIKTALKLLSALLPPLALAVPFAPWDAAFAAIFALLALSGFSTGACYSEFNAKSDSAFSPGSVWAAELLGGTLGACLIALFLLPGGGFAVCATALAASRIPAIIGK